MNATTMQLASGAVIDLRSFSAEPVTIEDVGHQLAQINRYTGAALRPISVAEHSLLVCEIARRELGLDVHGQLAALMHDAHEIVTGDCSSPAKVVLGDTWHVFEHRWQVAFSRRFKILTPSTVHRDAIRRADLMALATERGDLLAPSDETWPVLTGIEPVGWSWLDPNGENPWTHWAHCFVKTYHRLANQRAQRLEAAP